MILDRIRQGALEMGVALPDGAAEKLAEYLAMLRAANEHMNLARALEDDDEAVDRHLLDSVAPLGKPGFPRAGKWIDVGTGAGLPGIPLAICLPEARFTLLDALDKRVKFLQSVIDALGLSAEAVHLRAEDGARDPALRDRFDVSTARAVAPLGALCEWCAPFLKPGGLFIAYKGPGLSEELPLSQNAMRQTRLAARADIPIEIPGRDWAHRVFVAAKTAPTPARFPRKNGEATRKPL